MAEADQQKQLTLKIAKILDECRNSYATHNRKLKELSILTSSPYFLLSFSESLLPIFTFHRRTSAAERVVRFVSTFAVNCKDSNAVFLEEFLQFLLSAVSASDKTARFRSCQIISTIIMQLPDDAEVSDELWDEVIESMKIRIRDKIPKVRIFAIMALSRFVNDLENSDILESFLEALALEHNQDVRKIIILSLPPSNATSSVIIDHTLDVSESVRKAAYFVLANKFPLQSLSIKLRTVILQRGLSDRSPAVVKECLKLMKDEWLTKCCNGDPLELLKFLDVETYESVGNSVMQALLGDGMFWLNDRTWIHQFRELINEKVEGHCDSSTQLVEPEVALYWRALCRHLQSEAQLKGAGAATTKGTEATVYAAEASDNNDLLEKVLPATVSDYVELVKAHLAAGPNYHFASRQLLLLGTLLDYSDTTNRRIASTFLQELLHRPLEYEMDNNGNKIVIGDGISLGGDRDWANAVAGLAKKVHAAVGEFEEVVLEVVEELAGPCRERTAEFMQWMHCLAVTGLVLENAKSYHLLQGKAIEPVELVHSILLPGAKHLNLDVQRVAARCLGLYSLLDKKPSVEVVKQLRLSFVKGPSPISLLAGKALLDLVMWHGPQEVDKSIGKYCISQAQETADLVIIDWSDVNDDVNIGVLDLLCAGLERDDRSDSLYVDEDESVQSVLGEGFAKILLLSDNYPCVTASLHTLVLTKLISLYFSEESKEMQRLKQCLSVFFEHYPCLSANHKMHLSKAFVPVMRAMWPGMNGNLGGSPYVISTMRKRAVQASHFMLQMMQTALYLKETENASNNLQDEQEESVEHLDEFESGEEGLAIRIAVEIAKFPTKKTAAEKSYVGALCKTLLLLRFRSFQQVTIKLLRLLMKNVADHISSDKELVKELLHMAKTLKILDPQPDLQLSRDQVNHVFERLELDYNLDLDNSMEMLATPVPLPTCPTRSRRRVRNDDSSSGDEYSPASVAPEAVGLSSARSQRASKTAALTKMTASRTSGIINDNIEEEEGSELTSENESDESNSVTE